MSKLVTVRVPNGQDICYQAETADVVDGVLQMSAATILWSAQNGEGLATPTPGGDANPIVDRYLWPAPGTVMWIREGQ